MVSIMLLYHNGLQMQAGAGEFRHLFTTVSTYRSLSVNIMGHELTQIHPDFYFNFGSIWILCLYFMGLNLSNQQIAQELNLNKLAKFVSKLGQLSKGHSGHHSVAHLFYPVLFYVIIAAYGR